jgi:carboxymethylenebutenolidase
MADDANPAPTKDASVLSRRGFTALSVGAAGLAAAGPVLAGDTMVETDVEIKTADGTCDAALFHPPGEARWPGAIIFTDVLGLRPVFRDMGRRLAAGGYTVLVPNPFYRTRKAPVIDGAFDFTKPEDRAKLGPLTAPLNRATQITDTTAYIAWLGAHKAVNRHKKIGVSGYCMGGPYTLVAASVAPGRVGAGGSFHGGGLVTDKPDSPHLLVPKVKASFYFGVAHNDDQRQPAAKDALTAAFAATNVPAEVEVYPADHGWCVKDNPTYDAASAERAWAHLISLYARVLA